MAENLDDTKDCAASVIEVTETPQPTNTRLGVWGCLWGLITNQKDLIEYIDKAIENSTARIEETQIEPIFVNSTSQNTEITENYAQTQDSGIEVQSSSTSLKIVKKIIKK